MEGKGCAAGGEFCPAGTLEFERKSEHVSIKFHGALHVADKCDGIV
jgi:hypothetical protein